MHHLRVRAGNIDIRPLGIIKSKAKERPFAAQVAESPLVAFDLCGSDQLGRMADDARGRVKCDHLRCLRIDSYDCALLQIQDEAGSSNRTQTHHRGASDILDLRSEQLGVVRRQSRREATARLPRDRLQGPRPLFVGDARQTTYIMMIPDTNHMTIRRPTATPR
jgi:hypothetical protein